MAQRWQVQHKILSHLPRHRTLTMRNPIILPRTRPFGLPRTLPVGLRLIMLFGLPRTLPVGLRLIILFGLPLIMLVSGYQRTLLAQEPGWVREGSPVVQTLVPQTPPSQPPARLSFGPVLSVGTDFPTYVVDEYCGATRSYGIGVTGTWVPKPTLEWLGLEGEVQYVTAPFDVCAIPDLLPAGERRVVEADLSTPFTALNGRVVLSFPFGPGRLRIHGGGGVSVPRFQPIMSRGVGLVAQSGRWSGSLVLDWWTLWPGGEVFNEEWDEEGTRRDLIGPLDDWFHVRFVRISVGWALGGR